MLRMHSFRAGIVAMAAAVATAFRGNSTQFIVQKAPAAPEIKLDSQGYVPASSGQTRHVTSGHTKAYETLEHVKRRNRIARESRRINRRRASGK